LTSGCTETLSPRESDRVPLVVAVTAPTAVLSGQAVDVTVHWGGSCERLERITVHRTGPHTYDVTPIVSASYDVCVLVFGIYEAMVQIPDPPQGRFSLHVNTALSPVTLDVVGGVTVTAPDSYVVRVRDQQTGEEIPGARVAVLDRPDLTMMATDTLGVANADAHGTARLLVPCTGHAYELRVSRPGDPLPIQGILFRSRRCPVPLQTVVLL
jgi:hypothetical protein